MISSEVRTLLREKQERRLGSSRKQIHSIRGGEDHIVYFGETLKGELTGIIWLAKRRPFYKFKEELVWISNLYVIQKHRRKGLAKKLLEKAEEWAAERELKLIGLHTLDFDTQTRNLYETSGYRLIATHNESCFYEKKITPLRTSEH